MPTGKFDDIIERVEKIRVELGLNKSRFSGEIDMKPQTYNNFIGAQNSKPNIELIRGIINRYNVNPDWLLNGFGGMFREPGESLAEQAEMYGKPFDPNWQNAMTERSEGIHTMLKDIEKNIRSLEKRQPPLADELSELFSEYFQADPVIAAQEVRRLLHRLHRRLKSE